MLVSIYAVYSMFINKPDLNTRPEVENDSLFLEKLFRSTRDDLLMLGQGPFIDNLIRMQFHAQQSGYRSQFPDANCEIIERNDEPVGYWVVDDGDKAIRLVYIAFLPHERNQGHGRCMIQALQAKAESAQKALMLSVDVHNEPAKHLYFSSGFQATLDDGIRLEMIWNHASMS